MSVTPHLLHLLYTSKQMLHPSSRAARGFLAFPSNRLGEFSRDGSMLDPYWNSRILRFSWFRDIRLQPNYAFCA